MRNFTILLLSVLLLSGCGKKDDKLIDASVTGKIILEQSSSYEGVKITARSGDINRSAWSESDGTYYLDGLKTGTYILTFEKEGYMEGTWKGVSLVGGDEAVYLGSNYLSKVSDDSLVSAEINIVHSGIDYTTGDFTGWDILTQVTTMPKYHNTQVVVFVSKKSDVAYNRYDFFMSSMYQLEKPDFKPGDQFFARVYLTKGNPSIMYFANFDNPDPETGAMLYYGIITESASEVIEFTLN